MEYQIQGTVMQTLSITLGKGESVFTESGGMAWMRGNIKADTGSRGGIMSGLGRMVSGESLFLTTYTCHGPKAQIAFTPEVPGKVLPFNLASGQSLICQKDAFMCAQDSVKLEIHFHKKLGAGLFGGEGFILQKITGPGMAFLEIPGEVHELSLSAGEEMKADPGHIALFEPTVSYNIARVKGVKNILFSGEGLFLSTLKGPGKVWLQSLPISNMAVKLARYMPVRGN